MSGWVGWMTILAAAAVTLLIRASFIVLPSGTRLPAWLMSSLRYVGAAVLPALITPDVLFRDLATGQIVNTARVVAVVVASLVAWRTKSVFATLAIGMTVMWAMRWSGLA